MSLDIGTTTPGSSDENVKVSTNDKVAGKLIDKVVSADGSVQFSEQNDGDNEKLEMSVNPSVGVLDSNITGDSTDADLLEKTLATYTLPGGTLANVGDGIHLHAHGYFQGNVNNKSLTLYFGASSWSFVNTFNNLYWEIDFIIQRINVGNQISKFRATASVQNAAGGAPFSTCIVVNPIEDLSNDIIIKITGQNGVAVANDIQFAAWYIKLFKA